MSAPHAWNLRCPWCAYYVVVNPRGGRGRDQGAGVEAAVLMEGHVAEAHGRTWAEYLRAPAPIEDEATG